MAGLVKQWMREFLAECLGTLILVLFGCGAVAATVLKGASGDPFNIGFGFGIGLMIGIAIAGPVSGAHLNPAVTVAMAVLNKFRWKKVPLYLFAQYLGGFIGAAVVFGVYADGIDDLERTTKRIIYGDELRNGTFYKVEVTGGIFATYPAPFVSIGTVIADQIVSVALLMMAILAVTDEKGLNMPKHWHPMALGLVLNVLIVSFGLNCGATLNPARDLAPRVFTAVVGYGLDVFKPLEYHYWWTAGLLGPHLGAIIGGWIYLLAVGMHNTGTTASDQQSDNNSSLDNSEHSIVKKDSISERARQVINESLNYPAINGGFNAYVNGNHHGVGHRNVVARY